MTKLTTKLAVAAAIASTTVAGGAVAAIFSQTATIEILDALSVSEATQMNFGIIETPSANVDVVITTAGATTGTTATFIDASAVAAGVYTITGTDTNTLNITASNVGSVTNLNFTDIVGNLASGGDVDLDTTGMTNVSFTTSDQIVIGATLAVTNGIAAGTYAPDFNLDVSYN